TIGLRRIVNGLLECGELIRGKHAAKRLFGKAITEALVTGKIAGETAAKAKREVDETVVSAGLEKEWKSLQQLWYPREVSKDEASTLTMRKKIQNVMWDWAGPLRTEEELKIALN